MALTKIELEKIKNNTARHLDHYGNTVWKILNRTEAGGIVFLIGLFIGYLFGRAGFV